MTPVVVMGDGVVSRVDPSVFGSPVESPPDSEPQIFTPVSTPPKVAETIEALRDPVG